MSLAQIVIDGDVVTGCDELRNHNAANVSRTTSN
jgi:hypothetical protein